MHQEVFYANPASSDRENLSDLHTVLGIPKVPDGIKKENGNMAARIFGATARFCKLELAGGATEEKTAIIRKLITNAKDTTELLQQLQGLTLETFGPVCRPILKQLRKSTPDSPESRLWQDYKKTQEQRLKLVRTTDYEEIEHTRPQNEDPMVWQFINILSFGIENSAHTSWFACSHRITRL